MPEHRARAVPVMTVPSGRFVWWRGLEIVDFIPNGKRIAVITLPVKRGENTLAGALWAATKHVHDHADLFTGDWS